VWWAELPSGRRRPVVLLSWDAHASWRDRVTVAEITRTVRDLDAEVRLGPDDGMPDHCVANMDNLTQLKTRRLGDRICVLSRRRMGDIELALHRALGMALPCRVGAE
jgi:mRNA interferase MazF